MLSELLERKLVEDAKEWSRECGLNPPFSVTLEYGDSVVRVQVAELKGLRQSTCTYTKEGKRNMYELERGK